ncbi:zf-HC2 domain-containing protein [[Ruminococcus] lactaris]
MSKDHFNACAVVQDILPQYYDNACSPASRQMVEQHLMTCEKC